MPKAAHYSLTWHSERQTYELHEHPGGHLLTVTPGEQTWFAWLDTVTSFTFRGKLGQFTVRKESRQWGDRYWYAYRRVGPKLRKKYLGRTADLTLVRLEEVDALLTAADVSQRKQAPIRASSDELVQDRPRSRKAVEANVPAVGADTITDPSARPGASRDPLLFTKLQVPRPRAQLVPRSHLTLQLNQGMACALTLVSAPAGFGKTTLLAQWLAERNAPAAWLQLSPDDNDSVRFLSYLIAALQTVDAHLGVTALELLRMQQPPSPETVVALLTHDLLRSPAEDVALVLDDYHVITTEPIHRTLTALIEHLPAMLHLVLSTRADPPLPLARLRAHGQLIEVRANELRFSTEEASAFLRTIIEVDLPPEQIAVLERRTEGWIAGLQLAALSLQGRADAPGFLAAFTGSHRYVLDYLTEEVLSRQPAAEHAFLLRTSVLSQLSGSLCDTVTGKPGSQAMLEALERANLFVVALDDERRWYRYHHLFAEVLRNRLRQAEPTLVPELHRRASAWYEQHSMLAEAVTHALAIPDFERVAQVIEQAAMQSVQAIFPAQIQQMVGWFDALPDPLVRSRPLLCVLHAQLLQVSHAPSEVIEARLYDAEQSLHGHTEVARFVLGQVALLRGILALYVGDVARCILLSRQTLDLWPGKNEALHLPALIGTSRSFLLSGDVTATSKQQLEEMVGLARSANLFVSSGAVHLLARFQTMQGRLRQAAATYGGFVQQVGHQDLRAIVAGPAYYFGLGNIYREWNELETAEQLLTQGLEIVRHTRAINAEVVALGYMALAELYRARDDSPRALALLHEFMRLAEVREFVPLLLAWGRAAQARTELSQDRLAAAISWADGSALSEAAGSAACRCRGESTRGQRLGNPHGTGPGNGCPTRPQTRPRRTRSCPHAGCARRVRAPVRRRGHANAGFVAPGPGPRHRLRGRCQAACCLW
jgi:LuxR family maltose regulon positive regulatory protein